MTVPHSERRARRYRVRTDCIAVAEDGGRLLGDRIGDLSWDGAFLETGVRARPGERLRLAIRVPGSRLWLDARGAIARIASGRRVDDAPGLGVRITHMDGMSRVLLGSVLRCYPPAEPRRGPGRDYARMVARIAGE